jgi:hypothetical protein
MQYAKIYLDATMKGILPTESAYEKLWNAWLWKNDCNAAIEESYGDMNQMHIMGILVALLESMVSDDNVFLHNVVPNIPLVHLHKKKISQYSLRELTTQVYSM